MPLQVVQNALVWSRLQNQPFSRPPNAQIPNNGYQGIDRLELKALWAIVAIESGLVVFFVALAIALMWVPCISACRQHKVITTALLCDLGHVAALFYAATTRFTSDMNSRSEKDHLHSTGRLCVE